MMETITLENTIGGFIAYGEVMTDADHPPDLVMYESRVYRLDRIYRGHLFYRPLPTHIEQVRRIHQTA
jgi:hypothetical protein